MNIVILAAGMGKRMHSDLPKVLHALAGRSLVGRVVDTARTLSPGRIVLVHGHGAEKVRAAFESDTGSPSLQWALQSPQLGTGHAVAQALPQLDESQPTLVLYGDVPLVRQQTLQRLVDAAGRDAVGLLTQFMDDPTGYGRIVRRNGEVVRVVEQKDADEATRAVQEINTGILVAPTTRLKTWLSALRNDNAQGEYYLTDIFEMAVADGVAIRTTQPDAGWETEGVNSKVQLAQLERRHQLEVARGLLETGVTLADPARIDVRGTLSCGRDVYIDVNCVFTGDVKLGDRVHIGPNCVISDATIEAGAQVAAMSVIQEARVGPSSRIGPFARLRPGTDLGEDSHIGNFVEIKNAQFAAHSKANHLAYVGDATVGSRVNIGAGTITCNYDGANKHRTVIEDDAFIGSDSQLVAPVTVRRGATLGAGTTLTREAPADALTISRARQTTLSNWKRPVKKPR